MPRLRHLAACLVALLAALALPLTTGCIGTPQPDPPSVTPEGIDIAGIDRGMRRVLVGAPGTVTSGVDATVWGVDLDAPSQPLVSAAVARDGSFVLPVEIDEGDVLRVWVENASGASPPIDLRVVGFDLERVVDALPCLTMPLSERVDGASSIVLESSCELDVTIDDVSLRAPIDAFAIDGVPALVVAGGDATIDVAFTGITPPPPARAVEVLLVTIGAGGVTERRAVTLFAP